MLLIYLRFEDCHFNVDIFEDGGYFNDGNAEDCYFNDGQGAIEKMHLLPYHWRSRPSYSYARTGAKVGSKCTQRSQPNQARGELEAGQEGHYECLGKAGGPVEDLNVVPPPEPTQVPPLPTLPLAGLA